MKALSLLVLLMVSTNISTAFAVDCEAVVDNNRNTNPETVVIACVDANNNPVTPVNGACPTGSSARR